MYHSLIISGKNTWDEWKLIPSSRPLVETAEPVTEYVTIPGRSGVLDLSTLLAGHILFSNRTGSWEFYVTNDYPEYDWVTVRNSIVSFIHGKKHKVILEDDPDWEYEGLLTVDWKTEKDWSKVTINYDLYPYAHQVANSPLYENISVANSKVVDVTVYDEYYVPTFTVSGSPNGLTVSVGDKTFLLPNGTSRNPRIEVGPGQSQLTFHGTGTVSFDYRGGRL